MTRRQRIIKALAIIMRSYREGYKNRTSRALVYEKYTKSPKCPMCKIMRMSCTNCICGQKRAYGIYFPFKCSSSSHYVPTLWTPSKNQALGRIKELAPKYHNLVIMEALKRKNGLLP